MQITLPSTRWVAIHGVSGDGALPRSISSRAGPAELPLVGRTDAIRAELSSRLRWPTPAGEIRPSDDHRAPEVVGMDEDIRSAIRNKKHSRCASPSIWLKRTEADACVSAGNTGP